MSEKVGISTKDQEAKKDISLSQKQNVDFSQPGHSPFDVDQTLYWQRNLGNQAVQRLMESRTIQAKLTIGQPNDKYKQEADRVADQVMRMPEPKESLVQRESTCTECMEEEEIIQTKPIADQITPLVQCQPVEKEEEVIMTKGVSGNTPQVGNDLQIRLNQSRGSGQPLPEETKSLMERRLGVDFSSVRVHTDSNAVQLSRGLNAESFTYGKDIYFGLGRYNPGISSGKKLLIHELTHVVQQRSGRLIQRRPLIQTEVDLALTLHVHFDSFETFLSTEIREARVRAAPLSRMATRIRQIYDSTEYSEFTTGILARLVDLFQRYLRLARSNHQISDIMERRDGIVQPLYQEFISTLQQVRAIPGLEREIELLREAEREAEEERRRQEEAAQWVTEYSEDPDSSTSRIVVGEIQGSWRVFKIHRNGAIYAIREDNLETAIFTPEGWYAQRGLARILSATEWLRAMGRSTIMQFIAGIVEGAGRSVLEFAEAVIRIDQTINGVYQALTNLGDTGRAIWRAVLDWKERFARGATPQRARMIGRIIGMLLFEVLLTRGFGRVVVGRRAGDALRALQQSRSVGAVRQTIAQLGEAAGTAGRAAVHGAAGALQTLRLMGLVRSAASVLRRGALEVVQGSLRIGRNVFSGMLYVSREAYYFLIDGARDVIAYIGRSLDEWAWGQRNGFTAVSSSGAAQLDDLAAELYRWLSTRQAPVPPPSTIASGARGLARISSQARAWLVREFGSQGVLPTPIQTSLRGAGDDIIDAINRFHSVDGFVEVVRDYAIRRRRFQQGARYVMRFARAELSDRVGHVAMRFEFPSGRGVRISGRPREVDIWVAGVKYEFKSVLDIHPQTVRRQFIPDLYTNLGTDLSRINNLRWIFDSRHISLSRQQVVQRIQSLVQQSSQFQGFPRLNELLQGIDGMIVFWP